MRAGATTDRNKTAIHLFVTGFDLCLKFKSAHIIGIKRQYLVFEELAIAFSPGPNVRAILFGFQLDIGL